VRSETPRRSASFAFETYRDSSDSSASASRTRCTRASRKSDPGSDQRVISGSPEPNYEARAFGVLAVAQIFRVTDKGDLLRLLAEIRPSIVADPQAPRLLDLKAAAARLQDAYDQGRIQPDDLDPSLLRLSTIGNWEE
jgi:hypothetical protein